MNYKTHTMYLSLNLCFNVHIKFKFKFKLYIYYIKIGYRLLLFINQYLYNRLDS